jgi:hypothetical protein
MEKASHQGSSPDLAPVDFYLFNPVKVLLKRSKIVECGRLLQAVTSILNGIEKSTLKHVFHSLIDRADEDTTSLMKEV